MSATRTSLLVAAALAVLAPASTAHAQYGAYGARAVVEHNDLRWFEPVDLDVDGQMPHRDAGYFASVDKLWWTNVLPQYEIGHPGLIVDSERIYPAPPVSIALTNLEQFGGFDFVDGAEEALDFTGTQFATFDDQNTPELRDDVETVLSFDDLNDAFRRGDITAAPLQTVADLRVALVNIEGGYTDAGTGEVVPGQPVRVANEPNPYGVRNSIVDAFPDAPFAWGERYEFGYSDGEQGWMIGVLDGPEMVAGGTWGAGEAGPYTSQTGTDVFGPDPYFLGDLVDDDGDGIGDGDGEQGSADIFALGFGSVAVNFWLPNPDYLTGFRDYDNGQTPFTTSGPIMYVGNVGAAFNDINVVGLTPSGDDGLNVDGSLAAINTINSELDNNMLGSVINSQFTAIMNELVSVQQLTDDDETSAFIQTILDEIPGAFPDDMLEGADKTNAQTAATTIQSQLNTLNNILQDGGGGGGGGAEHPNHGRAAPRR